MARPNGAMNRLETVEEKIKPSPFQVTGFYFEEDKPNNIDHRNNQLRLGFTQSAKESDAFHKAHLDSEFAYLGNDYLDFMDDHA